jgi:aspartyl-tRNA(Asn)/glutamyl-tRNA(Gln) amidotransferase subunit A
MTFSAFDNYFLQAQRVRQLVRDDFDAVFSIPNVRGDSKVKVDDTELDNSGYGVDILLHPSAIGSAPALSSGTLSNSSLDAYVQDLLTVPASLAGLPALNVPCPAAVDMAEGDDGWPIGCSIIGQWGSDELVLDVGKAMSSL